MSGSSKTVPVDAGRHVDAQGAFLASSEPAHSYSGTDDPARAIALRTGAETGTPTA